MPPSCSDSRPEVDFLEASAGTDPALDVALPHALVGLVAEGRHRPVVRCYRPAPTVAFGRRDSFLAGFEAAAAAARQRGYSPVVRGAGGRAAAYHEGCLILDEVMPSDDSTARIQQRFADDARRHAAALRSLGIDARVGEVPGEYCPGEFTVNARGRVKLIGAAQRIVRGAWLLSSVVVVDQAKAIRDVLTDVYAALGLDWDPDTVGAIAHEAPNVGLEEVRRALLAGYEDRYELQPTNIGDVARTHAQELLPRHEPWSVR